MKPAEGPTDNEAAAGDSGNARLGEEAKSNGGGAGFRSLRTPVEKPCLWEGLLTP